MIIYPTAFASSNDIVSILPIENVKNFVFAEIFETQNKTSFVDNVAGQLSISHRSVYTVHVHYLQFLTTGIGVEKENKNYYF